MKTLDPCGRAAETQGYAPCTRTAGHHGPCAHRMAFPQLAVKALPPACDAFVTIPMGPGPSHAHLFTDENEALAIVMAWEEIGHDKRMEMREKAHALRVKYA